MSFAELHGKVSGDYVSNRSEDLLTSDVFGTLHFLGPHRFFQAWLKSSLPASGAGKLLGGAPVVRIQMKFWPRLDNNREPDAAILCEHADGQRTLIVMEAKYHSGLSNTGGDGEEKSGHQILDQCRGMVSMGTKSMLAKWFPDECGAAIGKHLLVTADSAFPRQHYVGLPETGIPMFWQSWCALVPILESDDCTVESCEGRLIEHLTRLLRQKGLAPFEGFAHLGAMELRGDGHFWQQPAYFQANAPADLAYRTWWRRAK